jgi:DNA gyrase subunit A
VIRVATELVKDKKLEGARRIRQGRHAPGGRAQARGDRAHMQVVFGVKVVALVQGRPRTLNVKDLLECFLRHRREVVTRRTLYQLRKARDRAHVREGLAVALANIDPIIALMSVLFVRPRKCRGLL